METTLKVMGKIDPQENNKVSHIDGLMQKRPNCSVNALELFLLSIEPSLDMCISWDVIYMLNTQY